MANEGGVAAVDRALTILDAFREGDQSLTLTEISKRVGKHTTHIYNALSRLELAPKVIEIMRSGQISTDMRIVTAIKDLPQDVQVGLIERAAQYKMTIPGIVAAARKVRKSLRDRKSVV